MERKTKQKHRGDGVGNMTVCVTCRPSLGGTHR